MVIQRTIEIDKLNGRNFDIGMHIQNYLNIEIIYKNVPLEDMLMPLKVCWR